MGTIIINKINDEYKFYGEDEETCERFFIGSASERREDDGDDRENVWFEGRLDTRSISFYDEDELMRTVKRIKPRYDVYFE